MCLPFLGAQKDLVYVLLPALSISLHRGAIGICFILFSYQAKNKLVFTETHLVPDSFLFFDYISGRD
jgi:hypothetical protein